MVQDFIDGLDGDKFDRLRDEHREWRDYLDRDRKKQDLFSDPRLNPDGNIYQARVPTYRYFGQKNRKTKYDLQVKCVFDGYVNILYNQYHRRGLIDGEMSLHEFCSTYIDYDTFATKFYGRDKAFWLSFNEPRDSIDDYF